MAEKRWAICESPCARCKGLGHTFTDTGRSELCPVCHGLGELPLGADTDLLSTLRGCTDERDMALTAERYAEALAITPGGGRGDYATGYRTATIRTLRAVALALGILYCRRTGEVVSLRPAAA